VTCAEIEQVISEMGPVAADGPAAAARDAGPTSGASQAGASATSASPDSAPRRLYQISEGAIISGVCNGIAAYFAVDVTLVRVMFVALTFLTGGGAVFAYLILMFLVPYASTSEQHAEARGLPFNARALVERAKRKAAEFAHGADWRQSRSGWYSEWRQSRAEWRRARAEWRFHRQSAPGATSSASQSTTPAHAPYAAHIVTGFVLAVLGLILVVFSVGWLLAFLSLLVTGAIFGWSLPGDLPFWLAVVVLIVVYNLVSWPIKAARHAAFFSRRGYYAPWVAGWDGVMGIAILAALLWYCYHHVPEVHALMNHLRQIGMTT